jgi:hypothetical protein
MRRLPLLFVLTSFLLTACASQRAASPIPDTPEARAVLTVIESYRQAMESRDVDAILGLASRDYHDRMGSPDPETDVFFEDLEEKLAADFEDVRRIRLNIEILRIEFDEAAPIAEVNYRYDVRYQVRMPAGDKWHNALDVNRMVLHREEDGSWRVTAGL